MRPMHALLAATAFVFALHAGPSLAQADHMANLARAQQSELPPVEMTAADRQFLGFAIERSRVKAQALEIATERAESPELRVLAESMHDEHFGVTEALLQVAGRDSEAAATEMAPYPGLAELRTIPTEQFDERLFRFLRALHRETLPRFQAAAEDGQLSPRVQRVAGDAAPMYELHLELIDEAEAQYALHE